LFSLNPVIPFSIFFSRPLLSVLYIHQSLFPLHHLRTLKVFWRIPPPTTCVFCVLKTCVNKHSVWLQMLF
jgi:hypothetical protein